MCFTRKDDDDDDDGYMEPLNYERKNSFSFNSINLNSYIKTETKTKKTNQMSLRDSHDVNTHICTYTHTHTLEWMHAS